MEILQNDIFGKKHKTTKDSPKKQAAETQKSYPNITIINGIDENQLSNDFMLIHRTLQKKLLYLGELNHKQKNIFLRILKNEMNIKGGKLDPITSTRDSLLAFFAK